MVNGKLKAEKFGEAATEWGEQFFKIRILQEKSKDRLTACIEAEIERNGETRQERIAAINKQLDKLD